ncbi:MAG: GtrA family protein [Rhodospirillaceae bacterium]|nr:GtrA family protein [Rhodospirillaceae bacterium]
MRDTAKQFLSFGAVGVGGLIVDTAVLYVCLYGLGLGFYGGRVVSYLAAATFTWAMNRRFTFTAAQNGPAFRQWLTFLAANGIGAVVNYGTYAALIAWVALVREHPALGVAAGSIAGLAFNFTASKRWVFKAD